MTIATTAQSETADLSSSTSSSSQDQQDTFKTRIMEAYSNQQLDPDAQSVSTTSDALLDLDPNTEYAQVKLKIFRREMKIPSEPSTSADKDVAASNAADEARLKEIRAHYFFKQKDAEAEFRKAKSKALMAFNEARLRDMVLKEPSSPSTPTPKTSKKGAKKERPPSIISPAFKFPSPKKVSTELPADETNSEVSHEGGMFGTLLDEMPASELVSNGPSGGNTLVKIRDLSLPKQWGGRTPKQLLADLVHKQDKVAAVAYFQISSHGASRAVRAGVTVRWGNASKMKPQEWRMEEDGCHDLSQAEQFIAVVALHALTYVVKAGFATPTSTSGGNTLGGNPPTHFRLLPAVYRDLWDELEAARKESEDAINRSIWRQLKDIIEPRLGATTKVICVADIICVISDDFFLRH